MRVYFLFLPYVCYDYMHFLMLACKSVIRKKAPSLLLHLLLFISGKYKFVCVHSSTIAWKYFHLHQKIIHLRENNFINDFNISSNAE